MNPYLHPMKLSSLHTEQKSLSVIPLKKNGEGTLLSIHLEKGGELPNHKTAVPTVLVCVSGNTTYSTERGEKVLLQAGDMVNIEPHVVHRLEASEISELLLMK